MKSTNLRESLTARAAATRVLVIDDDEFEREFVISLLIDAGFDASGFNAVVGVTNHLIKENIGVVVIDVMMPTIRGDKLAKLLRGRPALANLGIILISSLPEAELRPLIAALEVDAFVSKANVRAELASTVARAASRNRLSSGGGG